MTHTANRDRSWNDDVKRDTAQIAKFGYLSVGLFLAVFCTWAVLFPLASAVVARGTVISSGKDKLIQHPTGGTITAIHVTDGARVAKGAPILTLDPVVDKAELNRLESRLFSQKAARARLSSFIAGKDEIEFPSPAEKVGDLGLRAGADSGPAAYSPSLQRIINTQIEEFAAIRHNLLKETEALVEQKRSLEEQLKGLVAREQSMKTQLSLIEKQEADMAPLARKGFVARNRFNELRLQVSELQAAAADNSANVLAIHHQIDEVDYRIDQITAGRREDAARQLTAASVEIEELRNQVIAARRIFEQRQIVAPVSGIVSGFSVHTVGGVVTPNQTIAEIVPEDAGFSVEARIEPKDIDVIQPGGTADIVITAFNNRLYDPVKAEIAYIAANSVINEQTGEFFYTVRLDVNAASNPLQLISKIRAGMEGDVFIQTGSRVFLSYLFAPIADSFRRAFREK